MRDGDGFGKTEACRETKEGGGLASAKPKLTEKRSREEDWLRRNRSLLRNEGGWRMASAKPKLTEKRNKGALAKRRLRDDGEWGME